MRLSPTLALTPAKALACAACGHVIGPAGEPWKPLAALRERPLKDLGEAYPTRDDFMLREFSCPECGALLDSETAVAGDPFLDDVIFP